jgi:chromosome segregation ATPase
LNAAASKIAELEAAGMVLSHVLAETDAELENMAQRRKTILAADAPPAEIDKQLERHDETVRALTRRNEIAAAVSTNLVTRIAADREVERAAKRRTNYDEALILEFDHRDPSAKSFVISDGYRETLKALKAEIAKCDVRCANCHRKRHAIQRRLQSASRGLSKPSVTQLALL